MKFAFPFIFAWALIGATTFTACSAPDTVDPLYYVLFPVLAGAGDRPAQPGNLRGVYNPLLQQIELTWDSAVAPSGNFLLYRVYVFTDGPPDRPEELYRERDRLTESGLTSAAFRQSPYSGSLYFLVTAFNGISESLPSNVADVNVFSRSLE